MRKATVLQLALSFAFTTPLTAQQKAAQPPTVQPVPVTATRSNGSIRGTVFDSLTMSPAAGALVWIASSSASTVADSNGKFVLENVPGGSHQVLFSSGAIDSTGLGSLGHAVEVVGNATAETKLATPSFRTLWKSLCAEASVAKKDSGIVWGTIRDAHTDSRLSGAGAIVRWYDLQTNAQKKLQFSEEVRSVRTDSIGNFYACGLPAEISITTQGTGERSASGAIEHVIGIRRIVRMDLSVSRDMVLAAGDTTRPKIDSASIVRVRGSSTLRGIVRDDKGKPMAGATVTFATADTSVRSGNDGSFFIASMPAGTHSIQARQIGFRPVTAVIDLKPQSVTDADLRLLSGQELATFNVRANVGRDRDHAGYLERRRTGLGYAIEGDFSDRFDVRSILESLGGVTRSGNHGRDEVFLGLSPTGVASVAQERLLKGKIVGIGDFDQGRTGIAKLYIDGIPASVDQLLVYKPEFIRAIEVYPSRSLIPFGFSQGMDGGVVLVWTRNAKW
ncbi:MAG: carboxypeptidase regulatory-like domain-containing protein [Gemmatimonadaceae bacterium]